MNSRSPHFTQRCVYVRSLMASVDFPFFTRVAVFPDTMAKTVVVILNSV